MGAFNEKPIERIIQESVPGKQVTIAHVIASPMQDIYERLGIDEKGAIGILTL
ncbi:MAG: microcompartment protein, partial [Bacillota bacterium]|nr:microcompartment protein [Bacillota bacterium]